MWSILVGLSVVTAVSAQSGAYGQCGGKDWKGATTCVSGYVCTFSNEYYSQCIPGTAAITTSTTKAPVVTTSSTTSPTSTTPITSTRKSACTPKTKTSTAALTPTTLVSTTKVSTSTAPTSTSPSTGGTGPGTTLQSGYYWIRAVSAPNFHKYLQTSPAYVPGTALLESYTTAGQFSIVDGQLVELLSPGNYLYANVIKSSSTTKLAVEFKKEKSTYGTFAWSGDALQWSVAGLTRPNTSAWLVCEGQTLWVNLGSYGYMTPAGCSDQTIHYYNDKTANA
ncbi:hypothetical protein VTL71DRAFT_9054 [Oculimacula yallundae]|uniref:CBM1 domain-containing protein n=1 Tax=Oculimacula yallundae TaxID=86028 RepID=A0ABR4BTM1_9HELO